MQSPVLISDIFSTPPILNMSLFDVSKHVYISLPNWVTSHACRKGPLHDPWARGGRWRGCDMRTDRWGPGATPVRDWNVPAEPGACQRACPRQWAPRPSHVATWRPTAATNWVMLQAFCQHHQFSQDVTSRTCYLLLDSDTQWHSQSARHIYWRGYTIILNDHDEYIVGVILF
jgi:hypothetical protein